MTLVLNAEEIASFIASSDFSGCSEREIAGAVDGFVEHMRAGDFACGMEIEDYTPETE